MLCCATIDEAMAKFDMFLHEWTPPRIQFNGEYLNVLSIAVLASPAAAPASSVVLSTPSTAATAAADELQEKFGSSQTQFQRDSLANDSLTAVFVRDENRRAALLNKGVRRITLVALTQAGAMPAYFTYRQKLDFREDATHRHCKLIKLLLLLL